MPNIEKTFISKDPDHRNYWFPATGSMINWQLNTTKAPFNDTAVRKALSMAVDRDQITKIGMSGYTKPADCTGPVRQLRKVEEQDVQDNCDWTKLNVDEANKVLDKAGYPKERGRQAHAEGRQALRVRDLRGRRVLRLALRGQRDRAEPRRSRRHGQG